MSRSRPDDRNPNPAVCRFRWKGGDGKLIYYDRTAKQEIDVPTPFRFLWLDETSTVTGYSKPMKSGLFANEVKDTLDQPLRVKWQKDGTVLAEGLWQSIKDKVKAQKGRFAVNVYIAFFDSEKKLQIGKMELSGSSMRPWFEFRKENREALKTKAVTMKPGEPDQSGDVDFIPPVYALTEVSDATNALAAKLDDTLQEWFTGYFKKPTKARTEQPHHEEEPPPAEEPPDGPPESDDVPF